MQRMGIDSPSSIRDLARRSRLLVGDRQGPTVIPPLQTWFQLCCAVHHAARDKSGIASFQAELDDRAAHVVSRCGVIVVQPVVADGEGVRHLRGVEEMLGIPIGESDSTVIISSIARRGVTSVAVEPIQARQQGDPGEAPYGSCRAGGGRSAPGSIGLAVSIFSASALSCSCQRLARGSLAIASLTAARSLSSTSRGGCAGRSVARMSDFVLPPRPAESATEATQGSNARCESSCDSPVLVTADHRSGCSFPRRAMGRLCLQPFLGANTRLNSKMASYRKKYCRRRHDVAAHGFARRNDPPFGEGPPRPVSPGPDPHSFQAEVRPRDHHMARPSCISVSTSDKSAASICARIIPGSPSPARSRIAGPFPATSKASSVGR